MSGGLRTGKKNGSLLSHFNDKSGNESRDLREATANGAACTVLSARFRPEFTRFKCRGAKSYHAAAPSSSKLRRLFQMLQRRLLYLQAPQQYHSLLRCAKNHHRGTGCLGKIHVRAPCLSTPQCWIPNSSSTALKFQSASVKQLSQKKSRADPAKRHAVSISNCAMSANATAEQTFKRREASSFFTAAAPPCRASRYLNPTLYLL